MKRDPLLYGVIGALIGAFAVWMVAMNAVNNNQHGMMRMMGMKSNQMMMKESDHNDDHSMMTQMDSMTQSLKGKTGDEFDKTFLTEMIIHHQGAIDMAKLAQQNAGHEEIKNLANDIITAQTNEIEMMKQWQKEWGL